MKLTRHIAMGLAAIMAAVTLNASPVHAATTQDDVGAAAVDWAAVEKIITAAKTAYNLYDKYVNGDMSVAEATRQILSAIYTAKTEIITRIDIVQAVEAKACAQNAVLDFEIFEQLTAGNKQLFARDARSCVNFIDAQLASEPKKDAVDMLGFALLAVGPIMLISSRRVGFSNSAYIPVLERSTQKVIDRLKPTCTSRIVEGRTQWTCVVYGDNRAGPEPSYQTAFRNAARGTSRPVAEAVLPILSDL